MKNNTNEKRNKSKAVILLLFIIFGLFALMFYRNNLRWRSEISSNNKFFFFEENNKISISFDNNNKEWKKANLVCKRRNAFTDYLLYIKFDNNKFNVFSQTSAEIKGQSIMNCIKSGNLEINNKTVSFDDFEKGILTVDFKNTYGGENEYFYYLIFAILFIWLNSRKKPTDDNGNNNDDVESYNSFSEIGGLYGQKDELKEIVDYFKNYKYYMKFGAKIPKGIMLIGEPGNGKTTLAKAVAKECPGVKFIYTSGSNFSHVWKDWGSYEVRRIFSEAKKNKNGCIIFIDEIDSLYARELGTSENLHTVNQILSEMDKINFYKNRIIVMASTNNFSILDKALTRAGRFDRKIWVNAPNSSERRDIISIYFKNKKVEDGFDLSEISELTSGMKSSDIESIINEALLMSIKNGGEKKGIITRDLILEAIERLNSIVFGNKKIKNPALSRMIAYHESGHAIIAFFSEEVDVYKINISGNNECNGYTLIKVRENKISDESLFYNKKQILDKIRVSLAGKIAEEIIFGKDNISVGSASDILEVKNIIRSLIIDHNMFDDVIGVLKISETSEVYKLKIEELTSSVIDSLSEEIRIKLNTEIDKLHTLSALLLTRKILTKREINAVLSNENKESELL